MPKKLLSTLLVLLILSLPMLLSSCDKAEDNWSSIAASEPPASSATEEPEPTATPTPAPTATPEPTAEPTPGADFEELFKDNAIDNALTEELDMAATTNAIIQAYNTAAKRWQTLIELVYAEDMKLLPAEDQNKLQSEYSAWENELEGKLDEIRSDAGDSDDGKMTAAKLIMEQYREEANVLSSLYFSAAGEMPDFERAVSGEAMG